MVLDTMCVCVGAHAGNTFPFEMRSEVGGAQPGNRFVSFVCEWLPGEFDQNVCGLAFSLFPFGLG